jgi:hypothetical protein
MSQCESHRWAIILNQFDSQMWLKGFAGTYGWVQVNEDSARDVFAAAALCEESLIRSACRSVVDYIRTHGSVDIETMLKQVTVSYLVGEGRSCGRTDGHTVPMRHCQAVHQLGQCEYGRSEASS